MYQKNKNLIFNIIGTFFIKGGAMLVTLLTTPAYIKYFNNHAILGLWFTLLSVLGWVLSFDLGIGNGLRNKLTVTIVNNDHIKSRKYISSAYIIVGSLSMVLCFISFFLFPYINWNSVFNISPEIVNETLLRKCVQIVFCGLMIQFTLKLITSILYSLQKSALTNLLSLISSISILIFVALYPGENLEGNLLILSYINVLAINVPLLITTIIIFMTSLRGSHPSIKNYDYKYAKSVLGIGATFFILQFMAMMIGNTNEFLISNLTSPNDVVDYQVYNRFFNFVNSIFNLAYIPIWSAATQQLALKNYQWLKNMHKILLGSSMLGLILLLGLVPLIPQIFSIWLGEIKLDTHWNYGVYFAIYTGLMIWHGANCSIANGLGWLKVQMVFLTLGAVANIPLSYVFVEITGDWLSIIIANIISLLPVCIAQTIYIQKKLNHKNRNIQ